LTGENILSKLFPLVNLVSLNLDKLMLYLPNLQKMIHYNLGNGIHLLPSLGTKRGWG
jgi:hypothetical protein